MKFRLYEGNGEAIYKIGVEDNGNPLGLDREEMKESLAMLFMIGRNLKAEMAVSQVLKGYEGEFVEV